MSNDLRYIAWLLRTRHGNPRLVASWLSLRFNKLCKVGFRNERLGEHEPIDVVIPTVSKDYSLLSQVIASVRAHLVNPVNNIYIVSRREETIVDFCTRNGCIFVDELSLLGYGKEHISYTVKGVDRSGWMFQQLLKLSAGKATELENYFILDSDTILISDHTFVEDDKFVFLQSEEWHAAYFKAFKKIFGYAAKTSLSYTSHMMIFNKKKLEEMKNELEKKHQKPWDEVYISTIDANEASCISDYDTYANWMLCRHPDLVISRPLYNRPLPRSAFAPLHTLEQKYGKSLKSLSFHSYIPE